MVVDATGPGDSAIDDVVAAASLTDPTVATCPTCRGPGDASGPAVGGLHRRTELYWPRQDGGAYTSPWGRIPGRSTSSRGLHVEHVGHLEHVVELLDQQLAGLDLL